MRKSTKIWLIIAALLVVAGISLFAAAMTAYHWNFTRLSTVTYETTTYEISESFSNISIHVRTADIIIVPSPEGKCRVECYEEEKGSHCVTVENDTLTVELTDARTAEDYIAYIGINIDSPKITVYLPMAQYASIFAQASTGSIRMEQIHADTLDLTVNTGKITLSDATCQGTVTVNVTTGKSDIADLRCENLISSGNTGDINMKNVIAADSFSIQRTTGDVDFDRCDACEIYVKTNTGDVRGSLLSEKDFIAQTDTGNVTVPRIGTGGVCQIDTTTGDIYITLVS